MFKKKIINKIGILINWTREIDFYLNLINFLNNEKFLVIVNDIKTNELERSNSAFNIIKKLQKRNINYVLFSEIYGNCKFKVLLSTGLTCPKKISLFSIFKFVYARTVGHIFEIFKIDKILINIVKKPLTAGGKSAKIYGDW